MTNTAQLRTAAAQAEKRLDWMGAARLWDLAADIHPAHALPRMGQLDTKDIAMMRSKAEVRRRFAESEARHAANFN